MKTIKLTSAACAKVVRDQTRSTTPCGLVRSKRICTKKVDILQIRRVNNGSMTLQVWIWTWIWIDYSNKTDTRIALEWPLKPKLGGSKIYLERKWVLIAVLKVW